MKFKIIAMLSLVSSLALATPVSIEKAKSFIIKKKACDFAAAVTFAPNKDGVNLAKMCRAKTGDIGCGNDDANVLCAYNAKIDKGTIKEREGCLVGFYNLDNDSFRAFFQETVYEQSYPEDDVINSTFEKGKTCTSEVLKNILTRPSAPAIVGKSGKGKVGRGGPSIWEFFLRNHIMSNANKPVFIIDPGGVESFLVKHPKAVK